MTQDVRRSPPCEIPHLVAGSVLIGGAVLQILAMAHHPSLTRGDVTSALEQLRAMASLAAWVHGILIALLLLSAWAVGEFCVWRGMRRWPTRAGLVFYAAGVLGLIGAAIISGFVTASAATLVQGSGTPELQSAAQLLGFCGLLNRALANFGSVALAAGIFIWSVDLLRTAGFARVVGAIGIVAGIATVFGILSGAIHLDVHGMTLVALLQSAWSISAGALLIRSKGNGGI
jgi:amino acid transporter